MRRLLVPCLLSALLLPARPALAEVKLPPLFSDHAVLQRGGKTAIWGTASPGEAVRVEVAGTAAETAAGSDGAWQVRLDLAGREAGPHDLTVSGSNRLVIHDVLIGEVWLCSGQSNMELPLHVTADAEVEMARSADDRLRIFQVARAPSRTPLESADGKWVLAAPTTTGGWSAAGYYFGKALRRELGVPVGLVQSAWGGTPIETWMGPQALESIPELARKRDDDQKEVDAFPARVAAQQQAVETWADRRAVSLSSADSSFARPDLATNDWKPVTLPGSLSQADLSGPGIVWLRRTVTVPPGTPLGPIDLGLVRGFDEVYWNGKRIAGMKPWESGSTVPRHYWFPGAGYQTGEVTVALRVVVPSGTGSVDGPPSGLVYGPVPLAGTWLAKRESGWADDPAAPFPAALPPPPRAQNVGNALFNGMISPLVPYGLRGILWYQGEANVDRAFQYRDELALLIGDWRSRWGETLPFYVCQLPGFHAPRPEPSDDKLAEMRESQMKALSLPATGEAVLIDLGEADDIHPKNKKDVGERLARIALGKAYGRPVVWSGPVCAGTAIEGSAIRVRFDHADGGLVARPLPEQYTPRSLNPAVTVPLVRNSPGSQVEGFAVCGSDRHWHWADAAIEGDTVVVRSREVPAPMAVRYAWAGYPVCNLFNGAGLPAAPFRNDDFPLVTEPPRSGQP